MHPNLPSTTAVSETETAGDLYTRSNLTRMQMLYWTGLQLRPDVPLYAAPLVFSICGSLEIDPFCTALQSVMDQSDALRTTIQLVDGVPQQTVQPQVEAPVQIKDFSNDADPETAAHHWFQQIITTPFDMQNVLVRFALARVGTDKHLWLMNQHHIIADATSSFFIYHVIARTYEQQVNVPGSTAPPAIMPYHIYRDYEREYRNSPQFERAARHWQQKLQKDVTPLYFFGQRARKKNTEITRLDIELEKALAEKLKMLAQEPDFRDLTEELGMFNILAALFFALMYHLTGNTYLTFLAPVHNRPTQAFRQTVGLLMELCPFVVEIEPNETPATLIQKLKQQTRGVMRFAQYGSSISLNSKAHDIMFNYHRRPFLTFNGREVVNQHLHTGHSSDSFALHIHEFEESGIFKLKFDFNNDIFTTAHHATVVEMFHLLLESFLTNRDQPLTEIALPFSAVQTAVSPTDTATPGTATAYVPPRDRLELDLKNMWEQILGVPRIGIHDNYFDLGGTSWQAMNLFAEIEKLTGHYLPLATLVEAGTIAALAEKLRQESGTDAWPTLVTIQEGEANQKPLYLVHGGGGHVLVFTKLARRLPDTQPVFAFQAKGLDGTTKPLTSVEEMAAHYVEALLEHQPQGPYQLAGYSMGGAVAFEMAQQLTARGHTVNFVGIIDTPAQHPNLKWVRLMTKLAARLFSYSPEDEQKMFIKNRHRYWVGVRQMMANQKNRFLHKAGRQPPQAQKDRPEQEDFRVQKITLINNRAFFCYVPSRYPGKVTLFKSTEGYRDIYRDTKDPLMGWQHVTTGVDAHLLPGNHNQIVDEPFVQNLAEAFIIALNK